jgi:hypothetical protein
MNRYVASWERLSEAMNRVTATGITEAEAKSDLCRSISDGAVKIRLGLGRHATNGMTAHGTTVNGEDVEIPPQLSAGDMDWNNSRPLAPWAVRRERIAHLKGRWHIEWIEVSREGVIGAFCAVDRGEIRRAAKPLHEYKGSVRGKGQPALEAARRAIEKAYSSNPDQATEPNKHFCRRVRDVLKQTGSRSVSDTTILRAAGRRK